MTQRRRDARTKVPSMIVPFVAAVCFGLPVPGTLAQQALTDQDRAEIRELNASYLRTLNACAAEEYADLFAPGGYFESTFRGRVEGREALMELVRSERHCAPGSPPRAAGTPPAMTIRPSAEGAVGEATLPNGAGGIEEHYVKTPQGWRLASRIVYTAAELESKRSAEHGAH